jgi:hypothetical protein
MRELEVLRGRLVDLNAALPDSLKDSERNLERHWGKPTQTAYIMYHTWQLTLNIDLNRFALPELREQAAPAVLAALSGDFLRSCGMQAIAYSISMARLWQALRRKVANRPPGIESLVVADWMAPACLIQAIKVLLVARKYCLWAGVAEASPAPLRDKDRPIDGAEVQELLECTLDCLRDFLLIKPDLTSWVCVFCSLGSLSGSLSSPSRATSRRDRRTDRDPLSRSLSSTRISSAQPTTVAKTPPVTSLLAPRRICQAARLRLTTSNCQDL